MATVSFTNGYLQKEIPVDEYFSGECHAALEMHFANFLGEDVAIIQADGVIHRVRSPRLLSGYGKTLIIKSAVACPSRFKNPAGTVTHLNITRDKESDAKFLEATVDMALLLKGPFYCEQLDVVICLPRFLNNAHHPAQIRLQDTYIQDLQRSMQEQWDEAPIRILANDPTGEIKTLYLMINGCLTHAPVTHHALEPARCSFIYRSPESPSGTVRLDFKPEEIFQVAATDVTVSENAETVWFMGVDEKSVKETYQVFARRQRLKIDYNSLEKEIAALKRKLIDKEGEFKEQKGQLQAKFEREMEHSSYTFKGRIRDLETDLQDKKQRLAQTELDLSNCRFVMSQIADNEKIKHQTDMERIRTKHQQEMAKSMRTNNAIKLGIAVVSLVGAIVALAVKLSKK